MKQPVFYRIAAVGFILLAVTLSGHAQSQPGDLIINIPFAFNVGEAELQAGDYVIRRDSGNPKLLIVQRADYGVTVIVYSSQFRAARPRMETSLLFNEYQGRRFLAQVQSRSGGFNHELVKTQSERRLIRIAATSNPEGQSGVSQ